ncbi:MAG: MoxR family ATPase [Conexivisphaerales archaeon]
MSTSHNAKGPASTALLLRKQIQSVIVGRDETIDLMLATLFAGGHILVEGPTGTGKTTLAKSFAMAIGGTFKRVQLTPDLLPADVIGTAIYDNSKKEFVPRKGPIFANVVMADELNRASPRTQSAFLEAMQEKQVTIDVQTYQLPSPFVVIATQVPEDTGGIYPLTRTQLDRFAVKIDIGLPSRAEEGMIIERMDTIDHVSPITSLQEINSLIQTCNQIKVSEPVKEYLIDLVNNARKVSEVRDYPSPRATIWLYKVSKAIAMLNGRGYVLPDDVKSIAYPVLSHRLGLSTGGRPFSNPDEIKSKIEQLLKETPVPKL